MVKKVTQSSGTEHSELDEKVEKKDNNPTNQERLQGAFMAWKAVNTLWQAGDGTVFFTESAAMNYARPRKLEVVRHFRDECLK